MLDHDLNRIQSLNSTPSVFYLFVCSFSGWRFKTAQPKSQHLRICALCNTRMVPWLWLFNTHNFLSLLRFCNFLILETPRSIALSLVLCYEFVPSVKTLLNFSYLGYLEGSKFRGGSWLSMEGEGGEKGALEASWTPLFLPSDDCWFPPEVPKVCHSLPPRM